MSMQHEYNELCSGRWAEMNPSKCPCNGRGFLLSDLDTWHRCPLHGAGALEREECEDMTEDEMKAAMKVEAERRLAMLRSIFLYFVNGSLEIMGSKAAVMAAVKAERTGSTPQDFVDAAERVAERAVYERNEAQAQARGFACGLEMNLANEAMWERKEAGLGY